MPQPFQAPHAGDRALDPFRSARAPEAEVFWRWDPATDRTSLSDDWQALIGTRDRHDWRTRVHADDLPHVQAQMAALQDGSAPRLDLECRLRHDDGTYRWVWLRGACAHDANGAVEALVGVMTDISDERRSRVVLERLVRHDALKSSLDGILATDPERRYTVWNPAMERITGLAARDVLGRRTEEVPFRMPAMDRLQAVLDGASAVLPEQRFTGPGGRQGWLQARLAPIVDDEGTIRGALGVLHDVTHEKARDEEVRDARDRLVRSEKLAALGTLVSGVGHELRTPMSYINNHLYLLKMLAERMRIEDPAMEEVAAEIGRRCDASMSGITRMANILDDLRATYRPEEAELREQPLQRVVEEALRLFSGAYEGPVQVERDIGPTAPMLIETGRIQQVVINLVNNAAEAMTPHGGTIRVRVRDRADGAEIVVADDGPGMPEEVRSAAFDPFFTTKKEGSGLGLYLVKQIVDRHMGTIECRSSPQGTTFRVFLPRRDLEDVERLEALTAEAPRHSARNGSS